jgi:hypothetical protein
MHQRRVFVTKACWKNTSAMTGSPSFSFGDLLSSVASAAIVTSFLTQTAVRQSLVPKTLPQSPQKQARSLSNSETCSTPMHLRLSGLRFLAIYSCSGVSDTDGCSGVSDAEGCSAVSHSTTDESDTVSPRIHLPLSWLLGGARF